jgi:hypothetical protein
VLFGEPRWTGENAAPSHRRPQDIRAPEQSVNRIGCALPFEEKDDFALADKDVESLEPRALKVEGAAPPLGTAILEGQSSSSSIEKGPFSRALL